MSNETREHIGVMLTALAEAGLYPDRKSAISFSKKTEIADRSITETVTIDGLQTIITTGEPTHE